MSNRKREPTIKYNMKIEKKKGSKKEIYIYIVVQSREREIDLRDLITLPVYLSLKNERKRKKTER